MYGFVTAHNRIDRASLNTLGAADTHVFMNKGDHFDFVVQIVGGVLHFDTHQICKFFNGRLATRRAFVNRITISNGFGVRATSGVAALATLGLWQDSIYLVHDRVGFYLKANRSKAEYGSKHGGQCRQRNNSDDYGTHYSFTNPVKPIKAKDIKPAVIIAMDAPLKGAGTSATWIRSRIEANKMSTSEKPTAAPKP
ncbi:Uncharacterised protein [Vibrio cholerae]|uniref:Uncharacterized protein n=1 Tax=Vibrio cholerae TaxID=666 RepID=A0A656AAC4_VIBCL|nr:Uncharacterised protein [Vibrio cholerae]